MDIRNIIHNRKLLFGLVVIMLFIMTVFFIPVKLHYTKSRYGKIYPARQWFLIRGNDGILISAITDNIRGVNHTYKVHQFERG